MRARNRTTAVRSKPVLYGILANEKKYVKQNVGQFACRVCAKYSIRKNPDGKKSELAARIFTACCFCAAQQAVTRRKARRKSQIRAKLRRFAEITVLRDDVSVYKNRNAQNFWHATVNAHFAETHK